MLQNENNYISVNNFMSIPKIPYQIFVHLLENQSNECEMLWKLLKYTDINCLEKDNLSFKEKYDLPKLKYLYGGCASVPPDAPRHYQQNGLQQFQL